LGALPARLPEVTRGTGSDEIKGLRRALISGGGNGAINGAAVALFTAGIAARARGKVLWHGPDLRLSAP